MLSIGFLQSPVSFKQLLLSHTMLFGGIDFDTQGPVKNEELDLHQGRNGASI